MKTLSEDAYRALYVDLLRQSWVDNPGEWEALLEMESVALACFCKAPPAFCHRHILKEAVCLLLEQRGLPFQDGGEIT